MKAYRLLFLGLLSLTGNEAIAQTACPPGMTPYGVGVCGYDNSQQQRSPTQQQPQPPRPPQQWASRWGAIATYEPNGSLGAATNMASKDEAEQSALADCQSKHGSTCKLEVAYSNGCGVLVGSNTGYVVTTNATLDGAIQAGMKTCADSGYIDCRVYYSACSLPIPTQ